VSTHATIVRLLESLGTQKEVRQYLQHYAGDGEPKIALIKVSGQVLAHDLDALADALGFLAEVRLAPVVVHGAGEQISAALEEAGVSPTAGARATLGERELDIARRTIHAVNLALVDALASRGTAARPITSGVLSARRADDQSLRGCVEGVEEPALRSAIAGGQIPVVAPLGETATGQIVAVDADDAVRALAVALAPHKAVVLNRDGGLVDPRGRRIPAINLAEDEERLSSTAHLEEVVALVHALPEGGSVSVTSPRRLPRELFTHRGDGTLVRRGEAIHCYDSFDGVDIDAVRALLERCFGRPLSPDYFATKRPRAVYVADAHRAVAVVTEEEGVPYLDKFGVTNEAQGAGVGASLWRRMKADHPVLFWRSRAANPINGWYFQQATGSFKGEDWVVFWTGLHDMAAIGKLVDCALAMPATMMNHGESAG
jgi:acetylglutamate synthase